MRQLMGVAKDILQDAGDETDADLLYQDEIHGSILEQIDKIVELVYRYSREIEHSDKNLERMEKMMLRDRLPWYRG